MPTQFVDGHDPAVPVRFLERIWTAVKMKEKQNVTKAMKKSGIHSGDYLLYWCSLHWINVGVWDLAKLQKFIKTNKTNQMIMQATLVLMNQYKEIRKMLKECYDEVYFSFLSHFFMILNSVVFFF